MSAPEAILFDLDGVLIDSRAAITGCMNDALESVGLPRHDPRELERFIGPPQLESFTELAGRTSRRRSRSNTAGATRPGA